MTQKRLTVLFFLLYPLCPVLAQEQIDSAYLANIDSLIMAAERSQAVRKVIREFEEKKLRQEMSFDGLCIIPLIRGALLSKTEHNFIHHEGLLSAKSDRFNTIDYGVGGLPLVATWVMKAAGVKSRSTTKRMAMSSAISLALCAGLTKGTKQMVNETRPDGSDERSMPSGHSAIAFTSATILAREYSDLSPWIPVGGYATAIGTQYLRLRHNKHWVNDVYMGAGIGLLAANLGYWLTDKIMPTGGILTPPEVRLRDMQRVVRFNNQPSGVTLVSGSEFGNRTFSIDDIPVKAQLSFTMGADVSWFLNNTFALELMARSTTGYAKIYDTAPNAKQYSADDIRQFHADVAAKYSLPFALGQRISARAFAGMRHTTTLSFTANDATELTAPSRNNFETGCGISYDAINKDHYAAGFACDYIHTFSNSMSDRLCITTTWKVLF